MTKNQIIKFTFCFSILFLVFCFIALSPKQGQALENKITFTWSANTYVPFDYLGKALPTEGSTIEIVANLKEKSGSIRKLDFNWFVNNKLQNQASGKGKQFLILSAPSSGRVLSIRLEIRKEGSPWASESLNIEIVKPQVVMHAGQNILPSISKYRISSNQETSFIAIPYFFNIKNIYDLEYLWTFNGQESTIADKTNPEVLTLKIGELMSSITEDLKVLVKNKKNAAQKAQAQAKITVIP